MSWLQILGKGVSGGRRGAAPRANIDARQCSFATPSGGRDERAPEAVEQGAPRMRTLSSGVRHERATVRHR